MAYKSTAWRGAASPVRMAPPQVPTASAAKWLSTAAILAAVDRGGLTLDTRAAVPVVDYDRQMVFVFETLDEVDRIWPAMTAILGAARAAADRGL